MATITAEEIALFSSYVLEISGIKLEQSKGYLIENRLSPLARTHNCKTLKDLCLKAKADSSQQIKKEIVDAISTNETFFFRDTVPFDLMRNKIVPDILDRRRQQGSGPVPLRIWSSACSTGQEVYSIAITLLEMLPDRNKFDISILGTDISGKAIAQASYGKYNQFEVERGLDPRMRDKYFTRTGRDWRIKDQVRSLAKFEKINLMKPFANLGTFDLVFCRNVAIYFSQADKVRLFQKIAQVLKKDGALIVGGSESLTGIAPEFVSKQYLRSIFYQLQEFDQLSPAQRPKAKPAKQKRIQPRKVKKQVKARPKRAEDSLPQKRASGAKKQTKLAAPQKDRASVAPATKELQSGKLDTDGIVDENYTTPARSLTEKIAGAKKMGGKQSFLASLQNKQQTASSSLLSAKQTESSSKKGSLLSKIASKNKKK